MNFYRGEDTLSFFVYEEFPNFSKNIKKLQGFRKRIFRITYIQKEINYLLQENSFLLGLF
jgi:hypothetical protein